MIKVFFRREKHSPGGYARGSRVARGSEPHAYPLRRRRASPLRCGRALCKRELCARRAARETANTRTPCLCRLVEELSRAQNGRGIAEQMRARPQRLHLLLSQLYPYARCSSADDACPEAEVQFASAFDRSEDDSDSSATASEWSERASASRRRRPEKRLRRRSANCDRCREREDSSAGTASTAADACR